MLSSYKVPGITLRALLLIFNPNIILWVGGHDSHFTGEKTEVHRG